MYRKYAGGFFAALTLLVMIRIFAFSADDSRQSSDLSSGVTGVICGIISDDFKEMPQNEQESIVARLDPFVRKLAHFSIYLALGACAYPAVHFLFCGIKRRRSITLAFCFCYALLDELHQYFVPGRAMRLFDVLTDTAGALVGIAAASLICAAVEGCLMRKYKNTE